MLLAAIGIYGVVSYSVAQRTQEIGIRLALGAERRSVFGMVLGHALRLAGAGVVAGVAAAGVLARLVSSQLFQTSEFDPLTFAAMAGILVAVALSPKMPVVLAGGILGIIAMRVVVGQLLKLIERYPALVDGAFVIIGWVAIKLIIDYLHAMHWIGWEIPQTVELAVVGVIFVGAYVYARWRSGH